MSRAGRPSARAAAQRAALTGMDGGDRLRAAIDAARRAESMEDAVVFVNNGEHGPNIIDARNLPAGEWLIEDAIPTGAVAALADLDDPSTPTLLEAGFDVVMRLHDRGTMEDGPVQVSVRWRPGLVPGREPPAAFWIGWDGSGFSRMDEEAA